eukprot:TRINITY_DN89_c0_g1_i1.p1 TRINITY_DN89_c0_g1~~TRINITY_DN89_c0_g1_i1.p1  ORF type:complete len:200 (-),score=69.65 TRINITY_DN89_c0_g1_i1:183-743(-)
MTDKTVSATSTSSTSSASSTSTTTSTTSTKEETKKEEQKWSEDDKKKGKQALAELKAANKNVMFIIARSKNLNIVVYEGMAKDSKLDPKNPIDAYWLNIDPAYVAETRKKGVKTDRTELIAIERWWAYGVSADPVKNVAGRYQLKLVALPDRKCFLEMDEKNWLARHFYGPQWETRQSLADLCSQC